MTTRSQSAKRNKNSKDNNQNSVIEKNTNRDGGTSNNNDKTSDGSTSKITAKKSKKAKNSKNSSNIDGGTSSSVLPSSGLKTPTLKNNGDELFRLGTFPRMQKKGAEKSPRTALESFTIHKKGKVPGPLAASTNLFTFDPESGDEEKERLPPSRKVKKKIHVQQEWLEDDFEYEADEFKIVPLVDSSFDKGEASKSSSKRKKSSVSVKVVFWVSVIIAYICSNGFAFLLCAWSNFFVSVGNIELSEHFRA